MTYHPDHITDNLNYAVDLLQERLMPLLRLSPSQADGIEQSVLDSTGSPRAASQALGDLRAALGAAMAEAQSLSQAIEAANESVRATRRRIADQERAAADRM